MIEKLKGAWEWIVAVGAALFGLIAYGWVMQRRGGRMARAKAKVEKARRERERADALIERAEEQIEGGAAREERAAREAQRLRDRARRRLEDAAVDLGHSEARAQAMTDKEIMEALGG